VVERSESIPMALSGYFARTIAFGLVKIWSWVTPPLVAVATLLLTMALYDVPMKDHYQNLAVITFLVTFFIFREIESIHPKDASGYKINTGNLLLAWALIVGVLLDLDLAQIA